MTPTSQYFRLLKVNFGKVGVEAKPPHSPLSSDAYACNLSSDAYACNGFVCFNHKNHTGYKSLAANSLIKYGM